MYIISEHHFLIGPVNLTIEPDTTDPVLIGFTVSFLCQAESIPLPTITWFQISDPGDPVQLMEGTNITITNTVSSTMTFSSLSVTVGGTEDFTEYQCIADNGEFFNQTSGIANLTRGCELKEWMDGWTNRRTDRQTNGYGWKKAFLLRPHV